MTDNRPATAVRIHPTAEVSPKAALGAGVSVWNQAQIREAATIGGETIIGKNCYIDFGVAIGARCKLQNNVSVFHGVTVGDGVFLGPHVCFTNDRLPRAINPDGSMKGADDWKVSETFVETGASIGAHSVILPGIRLGRFCLVAAGSVVTKSVPANGLVMGNPARLVGWVCDCGARLKPGSGGAMGKPQKMICAECGRELSI
jgi:UDP-2-acetamido-3-amino-2,3-dideoxy-glucuronate N-acetyltransferase